MEKIVRLSERELKNIIHESVKKVLNERKTDSFINEVRNFNSIIDKTDKTLNESSINRMLQWLKNCDCAFISAFRNELKDVRDMNATYLGPDDKNQWQIGKQFTHEENRQKNKLMVAELLQLGYGVTKVKGVYPEGMTDETSEESYLVVNRNDDENFLDNLLRISEYYNQDSIYYKEKGKTKGNLIGTNNNGFPEYHQKGEDSELKTSTASNYMSRMGNKAFSFVGKDAEKVKNRKNKMSEAANFWRNMVDGKMIIKEDIHPLTRKTMGEALRKMRNRKACN
jgi:hypothetical protein